MKRVIAIAFSAAIFATQAMANCGSGSLSYCKDQVNDAAKNVVTNRSNENVLKRVREVGTAVHNCMQCASENVSNTVRNFSGSGSGNATR